VQAATPPGGGYAAFGYLGQVLCGERWSRGPFAVVSWVVGVRARVVGMSRGGIGPSLFAGFDELLRILVLQSCVVLGLYLCFLFLVCLFGFFEDVDEVFTLRELVKLQGREERRTYGRNNFPGLVDYCDRFHERHSGGVYEGIGGRRPASMGVLFWSWNSFAENAVSREGFRGSAANRTKVKASQKSNLCQQSPSVLLFICAENKEERRGYEEEEEVTPAPFTGKDEAKAPTPCRDWRCSGGSAAPLVQARQSGCA